MFFFLLYCEHMKIRQGFVSNSSSSSFVFIFKSKAQDDSASLTELLMCIPNDLFNLKTSNLHPSDRIESQVNHDQVLHRISNSLSNDFFGQPKFESIDDLVSEIKSDLIWYQGKSGYESTVSEMKDQISKLCQLKSKGFNKAFTIHFGLNEGHVYGDTVGYVMEQCSDSISYQDKKLCLYTECHH